MWIKRTKMLLKMIRVLSRRRDGSLYWIVRIQRMNTNQVSDVKLNMVVCISKT
jgi:hypothetical protein